MWNVECGMWNVECGMLNVERGMWNVECGTWNVERGMWNVERGTWNVECGMLNAAMREFYTPTDRIEEHRCHAVCLPITQIAPSARQIGTLSLAVGGL